MHFPSFNSRYPDRQSILFWSFIVAVALFGGASRPDVSAQIIVRASACAALTATLLFGQPFDRRYKVATLFLAATALAILVQLVPLPPTLWRMLPGHSYFDQADQLAGYGALWRPISLTPDATLNALLALLLPLTMLTLIATNSTLKPQGLAQAILVIAAMSGVFELVQFAGDHVDNPFINDDPLAASGLMANRNHQAVLLTLGIVVTPLALLARRGRLLPTAGVATGIGILLTCLILATGSRAGMALSILAWAGAISIAWPLMASTVRRLPRAAIIAASAGFVMAVSGVLVVSIWAKRAISVDRLWTLKVEEDMRSLGLPTVWKVLQTYFPTGSGAGSFDPIFRVHEPFALLRPAYLNHAHNDWLEVVIDTGLIGMLLLAAAVAWWLIVSWSAWRDPKAVARRTGSLAILMLMLASIVDYPLRTPIMMAVLVMAACMASRPLPINNALPLETAPL